MVRASLTEGRGYEPGFWHGTNPNPKPLIRGQELPLHTDSDWNAYLDIDCPSGGTTWTPEPGSKENRPMNCVNWYHAYAFCIWDGGFLPSQAEWNHAATGGDEQRVFPWSSQPSSTEITCSHGNFMSTDDAVTALCGGEETMDVGSYPDGSARWGHADLAGNVAEWALDLWRPPYANPCTDCADAGPWEAEYRPGRRWVGERRASRGGGRSTPKYVQANHLSNQLALLGGGFAGLRCARPPL